MRIIFLQQNMWSLTLTDLTKIVFDVFSRQERRWCRTVWTRRDKVSQLVHSQIERAKKIKLLCLLFILLVLASVSKGEWLRRMSIKNHTAKKWTSIYIYFFFFFIIINSKSDWIAVMWSGLVFELGPSYEQWFRSCIFCFVLTINILFRYFLICLEVEVH